MTNSKEEFQGSLLETIIDNLPSAILIVDKDRKIVLANKTAEDFSAKSRNFMFGLRGGEAFNCVYAKKDPRGCGFDHNCRDCKVKSSVLKTFRDKQDIRMLEAELEVENIGLRNLRVSTRYLQENSLVLVAIEDTTEQNLIELERIEKNKILATIETSAAFCHEMNQPLQAISGMIDILLMRMEENDLQNRELLVDGQQQMKKLGELTHRLTNLSSFQRTKYVQDKEMLDIFGSSTL